MPLRRTRTVPNQRTDAIDFQRTNASGFANLGFALRHFVLGGTGLHRGGAVLPTGPASMAVLINPLAALNTNSQPIVVENQTTRAIAAAHVSLPRIDLVSIRYEEADVSVESRWHRDPDPPYNKTQQPTATEILSSPDTPTGIIVTTGTAAASPVAPATPAGYIALATIAVAAGVTTITAADIVGIGAGAGPILQGVSFTGPGGVHALPYVLTGAPLEGVMTPAGRMTLLFAQVLVTSIGSFDADVVHTRLEVTIETVSDNTPVAMLRRRFCQGEDRTLWLAGLVTGPVPATDYQIRFADIGGGGTAWGGLNVTFDHNLFGAITL